MTSYLSRLSPIPRFSPYTGPHKVGTIDVELPISELESPSASPVQNIPTVQYRIFYPCEPDAKGGTVNWLPAPQRGYVSAYSRFLGAGSLLAEVISFFPRFLHYISIPVTENAPLLTPPGSSTRWPVMIFSHGLGGSRNTYSHLVGSIASHGVIVIAPEHRDGSSPISYIREVPSPNSSSEEKPRGKYGKRAVDYTRLSHNPSPEVEAARNAQLKIRLWELGLVHDSLLKLDQGITLTNLNTSSAPLSNFKDAMDVHEPGKIIFAGHSFGAATVTQLVKSTFYSPRNAEAPADYEPCFIPSSRSPICSQITPQTPVILLDVWCLPLRAATTRWLWNLPFPCYEPNGPGGSALLALESQAFYVWRPHLKATKRLLSPDPSSDSYSYAKEGATAAAAGEWPQPYFFYASNSAHLSQSDFGTLFPWVTKRVFAAEEPERVMRLNVRAILQFLRSNDITVSPTSAADRELSADDAGVEMVLDDDISILGKHGEVRGWNWLSTNISELSDVPDEGDAKAQVKSDVQAITKPSEAAAVVISKDLLKPAQRTSERL